MNHESNLLTFCLQGETDCANVDLHLNAGFFLLMITAIVLRLLCDVVRTAVAQHAYPESLKRQYSKLINIF